MIQIFLHLFILLLMEKLLQNADTIPKIKYY